VAGGGGGWRATCPPSATTTRRLPGGWRAPADLPPDAPADPPSDAPADLPPDPAADLPSDAPSDLPPDPAADPPSDAAADLPPAPHSQALFFATLRRKDGGLQDLRLVYAPRMSAPAAGHAGSDDDSPGPVLCGFPCDAPSKGRRVARFAACSCGAAWRTADPDARTGPSAQPQRPASAPGLSARRQRPNRSSASRSWRRLRFSM
jgi:hypothetical protein